MKTRKSLFIIIILSTTFTAGVAKAASESPMQCKINQGNIECTVVSDNVEITNVILNRGRCDAPEAATQKDIEALNEFRNEFINKNELNEPFKRGLYFLENGMPTPLGLQQILVSAIEGKQNAEASLRVVWDPRGKYGFGDTVKIRAKSCNLIEFTIEANGQNWTWKTNQ